jgi:hypothetical protein
MMDYFRSEVRRRAKKGEAGGKAAVEARATAYAMAMGAAHRATDVDMVANGLLGWVQDQEGRHQHNETQ